MCTEMFEHFESDGMTVVYASETDMVKIMCNYTLMAEEDPMAMNLTAQWTLNDVVQASYDFEQEEFTFENDWADATGMTSYDSTNMAGMSMVHVPIPTLMQGAVAFMLLNSSMDALEQNYFNISRLPLD